MEFNFERKIEINRWIINSRWYYITGIFLISFFINVLHQEYNNFPTSLMTGVFFVIFLLNGYFASQIKKPEEKLSEKRVNFLSIIQIITEITIFAFLFHFSGGVESFFIVLFFIPVINAALLFGMSGAMIAAIVSGLAINLIVFLEFFQILNHYSRFDIPSIDFTDIAFGASKAIIFSIFYVFVAVLTGVSSRLVIDKEGELLEQKKKLEEERKIRTEEIQKIDETTSLLVDRDMELTRINDELDKKVIELEEAEKSQLRAFRDLQTERKKTEKEKYRTDAIISNFIDPIIVLNESNKISRYNPIASQLLGINEKDLGKKIIEKDNFSLANFKKIIKSEYTLKTSKELKLENNEFEEIEINIDGAISTYKAITAKVVGKNDEMLGTMKIFYNLTREKMLDKLKSEFISIAAHQLRTPLSAIKWVIQMVLNGDAGKLNEEQYDLLDKGYQSNERIIQLVNDMLNVSRIDEGRFGYSFEKSDFNEVLDVVISSLVGRLDGKNIKFTINKPDVLPKIYMDKSKMTLVLQNLLENAAKYTPEYGKIELSVEVGKKFIKGRVKDNGVGVPKEDQKKLFSKFFRASNVVRLQTEGSGLGLYVVKNVIEKHGGEIICNSEEGKGTEFVFTLPIDNK